MSEFKDEDRNMLVETHTLLKQHVKITDDHEKRIRLVESRQTKLIATFTAISAGVGSTVGATWHKFFG